MFCPQCGQQQVSSDSRFCSRCGFQLDGVMELLAAGGVLPVPSGKRDESRISPRRRGVRQGVALIMIGVVLTPLLGVFHAFLGTSEFLPALTAIIGFLGGPMRILYALIFEEGAPRQKGQDASPLYVAPVMPKQLKATARNSALAPPQSTPVTGWGRQENTAEIVQPPGVTENTTRLLDDRSD